MAGAGDDVVEEPVGLKGAGVDKPRAEQHVFVGKRHQGEMGQLRHQRAKRRVAFGRTFHGRHADEDAGRSPDALERGEAEGIELAVVAGLNNPNPVLAEL